MRLGVYCEDARAVTWLMENRRATELFIVPVTESDPIFATPISGITRLNHWEDLLLIPRLDAILVGGTRPQVLQAARQFAQTGKPLWVLPDPAQGLLFAYELNLAAQETQASLQAVLPHRADPAWGRGWAGDEVAGLCLEYVEFHRRLPVSTSEGTMTRAETERHLLMDLDLLTWLLGRRSRVTALRTGEIGHRLRRQTVTLAGDGVPEILWSIEPSDGLENSAECRFHAPGRTIIFQEANGIWSQTGATRQTASSKSDGVVPWSAAVSAFELFDAVEHSLERKRTVELHREPVSERAIFKTRMATWGCGVLLLTLFLMVGFLMIASVVPLPGPLLVIGRIAVFAPLFLFLLSQALLPLTRAASKSP